MKKVLLLMMVIGFVVGTYAQNEPVKKNQKRTENQIDHQKTSNFLEIDMNKEETDITRLLIGSAKSQRSFRREETRTISYNKELDVIGISFVLDKNTYDNVDNDGTIGMLYSADRGLTWSDPVILSDFEDDDLLNYYFSSLLYNPTGNTVVENAYGVSQSSTTDASFDMWNSKGFGSSSLNGDNFTQELVTNEDPDFTYDGYFSQFGLTQKSDFVRCFNLIPEGLWTPGFTNFEFEIIHGDFNGAGFDWEQEQSVIEFDFKPAVDGRPLWVGTRVLSDLAADAVWSDDGQIGYAWMVGVHEDDETGFQPILYKTTDGGDDWDFVDLDFDTDEAQDFLQQYIPLCNDVNEENLDFCIPWFNATVGAVDDNGNLQLVGDLNGHYWGPGESSEDDYQFSSFLYTGNLIKFTIGEDEDGNDDILDFLFVDSLRSGPAVDSPQDVDENIYAGHSGWLRRLQMSKNEASNEFFVTWTDTRDGNSSDDNNYHPDVMGWSYNSDLNTHSDPISFTEGTLYGTLYFYVQTSEYAMYDLESNTYTLPMVNAVGLDDFNNNTSGSGDPVDVHYISGINFPSLAPPVGLSEVEFSNVSVSQNQPNPFTGVTSIQVTSSITAPVMVEVTNIMGQTVYALNAGTINGTKKVELNANDLESGIYFYTVTIGNESVTKKMIVE